MRKKFTMLFAALLAFAGVAKADVTDLPQISTVENPIYYTIYNTRSSQPGGLMYYAGDEVGLKDGCTSLTLEDKYKFFFTGSHNAMYVHNAATGKKLATIGNGDKAAGSWTDEGTVWAVGVSPMGGGLAFGPEGGLNGYDCWNDCNYQTPADKPDFTTWSANDAGSIFVVELAENFVAPISGLFYVIEAPLFEKAQGVKKALYVNGEGNAAWDTEDLTNHNFYWIPTIEEDGTIALKNFGTGKYLSNATGTMSEEAVFGNLNALGSNSFNINFSGTIHANGHNSGQGANGNLVSWGGAIGSASAWTFVQKNDPTALAEVVVKYRFTYEGVQRFSQEINALVGEEWPTITREFPYGFSAVKPAGTIAAEDANAQGVVDKVVELSLNIPFVPAADYASIENWYYLKIKGEKYLYFTSATQEFMALDQASVDAANKDAYSWAFVGDPLSGKYQLVNKAAGADMVLAAPTPNYHREDYEANTGADVHPIMKTLPLEDEISGVWEFSKSSYSEEGFFIAVDCSFENERYKMNNRGDKLAFWTGGADKGSTFTVELRDDAAALRQLVASAQEYLTNLGEGTTVGCVTADSKTAISNAIAAANTAIADKTGYDEAQANLQTAIAAVKTIQPEEGVLYTIVSSCTKDHRGGQEIYVNNEGNMHFAKVGEVASETARVFQFVPANDGKFYLFNIEKGAYMQSVGKATELDVTKAKVVTIKNMGKDNIVSIQPDGQSQMHAQDRESKIVGWNENNYEDGSAWKIVETELSLADFNHTLNVSAAGWATLVLGYNTAIPAEVTAYAVSSIAEGKAVLTEVAEVLPAHTPVLIEAAAGEYAFNYTTDEATVASNLLAGSVFNTYVAPVEGTTNYVLSNNNGVVALYKKTVCDVDLSNEDDVKDEEGKVVENINDHITFAAKKAYLPVETATEGAPAMFVFSRGGDDESTGIDQLINANGEVIIYDLAGRRVEKMEKGIYIVNGKKVVK